MPTPCQLTAIYGPTANDTVPNPVTNAIIPLTGHYSLRSKIVYGDDEWQYLYTEYTFQFETIIYLETMTNGDDVEEEAARLQTILSTPHLKLKLYPIGLGEFGVINHDQFDIKGGPYPQDITVVPFTGNRSIMVSGSIMFRITSCITNAGTPGVAPTNRLLQYNIEQDFNVDEEGILEFTLNISYQQNTPTTIQAANLETLSSVLVRFTDKSFQGMKVKRRTSISRDGRTVSMRIVYKEHDSDSAFHPNTKNISVIDDLESSVSGNSMSGAGFRTWRRSFDISIRLPMRVHKSWAWYVAKRILVERFKNLKLIGNTALKQLFDDADAQPAKAEANSSWYIPLKIKITNPIYTRELKLNFTYLVSSTIKQLVANTKIFDRVDAFIDDENAEDPGTLSDQWHAWQLTQNDVRINGLLQYGSVDTPAIYNQCTNTATVPEIGATLLHATEDPDPDGSTSEDDDTARKPYDIPTREIPPELTWLTYKNKFEIIEESNFTIAEYLQDPNGSVSPYIDYYASPNEASYTRDSENNILNGYLESPNQDHPSVIVRRGFSSFYVRMRGHALRYNYKINIPTITTVNGKTARRMTVRSEISTLEESDEPIFLAKWDAIYFVEGGDPYRSDVSSGIKTTGNPAYYT